MRILFLSPRLCLPLETGAKIREYYLARALASHAEVTYVSYIQPGFSAPPAKDLKFFQKVRLVPLVGRYSFPKIVRGVLGRQPLSILNYTTREMQAAITEVAGLPQFDLVHVDNLHMAGYVGFLESLWKAPVRAVYNWHNIESEAMYRYGETVNSALKKVYAKITGGRLADLERKVLRTGFGHAVCSSRERDQLLAIAPAARLTVIENGVDTERFRNAGSDGPRRRLVFVGTMDYYPNVEAAVWFTRRIWPRVRERFPEWRLTLVGGNPTSAVRELGNEPQVEVTGTVPDVRPYYQDAVASIVPLHTGGGTRLKILEAMASGVPVISTSIGAEGLAVSPGKNIDIVDDEAGWLPALEALSRRDRLWDERASSGLELVRARYDWRMLGERLYQEYRSWLGALPV
jgi:glycosyltransferase involved in cell wall biosynthesis